jgi:hypothetical protein
VIFSLQKQWKPINIMNPEKLYKYKGVLDYLSNDYSTLQHPLEKLAVERMQIQILKFSKELSCGRPNRYGIKWPRPYDKGSDLQMTWPLK